MKQFLATQTGVSRFRQRCLSDDGSKQIEDDDVVVSELVKIQLVVLDFFPRTTEEYQMMMTASRDNDLFTIEKLLQCPCKPEMTDIRGRTPYTMQLEMDILLQLLLEAGAEKDAPDITPCSFPWPC